MFRFIILSVCSVLSVSAGYSSTGGLYSGLNAWNGYETYGSKFPYTNSPGYTSTNNGGYGGGYSGASSGASVGSAAGVGGASGYYPGFAPLPNLPPLPTPYEQQQYFQNLMASFQHPNGYSYASSSPNNNAAATSRFGATDSQPNLFQQQQAFFNNLNRNPGFGGGYNGYAGGYGGNTGGYGGGVNYASASGSYGPGGVHQTASIYPSNPSVPNVNTRFGPDEDVSVSQTNGQPGFVGISTSSFSSSSDVNGQKQGHREAVTSINDNGKVTTYRVHS